MATNNKKLLDNLLGEKKPAVKDTGSKTGKAAVDTELKISSQQEIVAPVPLEQIAVAPQVRKKLNEQNVLTLMESISAEGLKQKCSLRHFFNDEERIALQKKYPKAKYVMVVGHHRLEAMVRLGFKSETFIIAPKDYYADEADVIRAQVTENLKRADMTIFDIANGVYRTVNLRPNMSLEEVGASLGLSKGVVSKYNTIHVHINDDLQNQLLAWEVSSLNAIYNIATMIADGIDWLSLVKKYAVDEDGEFDPSRITERNLNKVKADLKAAKDAAKAAAAAEAAAAAAPQEQSNPTPAANNGETGQGHEAPAGAATGNQEDTSAVENPATPAPAESVPNEEVEKQDRVSGTSTAATTTSQPSSTSTTTAQPNPATLAATHTSSFTSDQVSFLKGIAFTIAQNPDCDVNTIAHMLKADGLSFNLDDKAKSIYEELANQLSKQVA